MHAAFLRSPLVQELHRDRAALLGTP
jgi:hypothetical protein